MQKLIIEKPAPKPIPGKITERVKTFEDACEVLGVEGEIFAGSLHDALSGDAKSIAAEIKLILIIRALNQGWKPDWNDDDEYKYYPWWDMEQSKSNPTGFGLLSVDCFSTGSSVGSRLCFKSEELAQYAAKQFTDLYKDYFTL